MESGNRGVLDWYITLLAHANASSEGLIGRICAGQEARTGQAVQAKVPASESKKGLGMN